MKYIPLKVGEFDNDFSRCNLKIVNEKCEITQLKTQFKMNFDLVELFAFLDKNTLSLNSIVIEGEIYYSLSKQMIVIDNEGTLELASKSSELFKSTKINYKLSDLKPFDTVILGNGFTRKEMIFLGVLYLYTINVNLFNEMKVVYKLPLFLTEKHIISELNPLILNISDAPRVAVDYDLSMYIGVDSNYILNANIIRNETKDEILEMNKSLYFVSFKKFHKDFLK